MVEQPRLTGAERVACEVCQKEIPKSAAMSAEETDYVYYFYGPECYEQWSADQIAEKTLEAGEP